MSRLFPQPEPSALSGADLGSYRHVMAGLHGLMKRSEWQGQSDYAGSESEEGGFQVGGYYGALLTSPPLAERLYEMSRFYRQCEERGAFPASFREFTNVVLAVELGYRAVLPGHIPFARSVGVRAEAIRAVLTGSESELDDSERRQVDYIRAVARGGVQDGDFKAMSELLGDRGCLEYTAFICYLVHHLRLMQAIGVPEPEPAELDAILAPYLEA